MDPQPEFFSRRNQPTKNRAQSHEKLYSKDGNICRAILIIFGLSKWCGMTLSGVSTTKHKYIPSRDFFISVAAVVSYVLSVSGLQTLNSAPNIAATVYAYITLGQLIRVSILRKKKQLLEVANKVSNMCLQLDVNAKPHLRNVKIQACLFTVSSIAIALTATYLFFEPGTRDDGIWHLVGFQIQIKDCTAVIYLIRISLLYSAVTSTQIMFVALIFCCDGYTVANNVLQAFAMAVGKNCTKKYVTKYDVIPYVTTYRHMMGMFKVMDKALAGTCLLLYASSVTSGYNAISLALAGLDSGDTGALGPAFASSMVAISVFFCLTAAGSTVNATYKNLNAILVKKAEVYYGNTDDSATINAYQLFIESVNNLKVYFTGADMFVIDKSLILTTAGAVVTYGVIIFT